LNRFHRDEELPVSMLRKGSLLVVAVVSLVAVARLAADPPAAPKLSTLVPAEDLAAQVKQYVQDLGEALGSEEQFKSSTDKIKKGANTLAVLCLVLSQHDTPTELTKAAPAVLKAAQQLATAKDYAAAKSALAAIDDALAGKGPSEPAPAWGKVAGQGQVMKEASDINTKLRNSLRRFDPKRLDQNARAAATLTAIATATMYDTHEVSNPDQLPKWYDYCTEFRNATGELLAKIKAKDKAGSGAALDRVIKSCDGCHYTFNPME
jgi:cytochrome c556